MQEPGAISFSRRRRPSPEELRRATHGAQWHATLDDPLPAIRGPARRLVEAAPRIITRDGLASLTLNNVAREAGDNKAMTAYCLGSKAGLIATVHQSASLEEYVDSRAQVQHVSEGDRLDWIVGEMLQISFSLRPPAF